MLTASNFREIVSGGRKGPGAAILRAFLRVLEVPYTWEVRRRNRAFDAGKRVAEKVEVPVISVGNLTLGGTGKTPFVEWVAKWFTQRGVRVALVSRGYKSAPGSINDEARELEQRLPGVPHLLNPDRVAAAREAIERFGCQVILLDDAFQHRRIARELDIVLIDALEPFGFGHVFPRGLLREPIEGLGRAHVIALSRADMVSEATRADIHRTVQTYAPSALWLECCHAPQALISHSGEAEPLESAKGQRAAVFCGLGNPAGFRSTVERCGVEIAAWREYPDHHRFSESDISDLQHWTAAQDISYVLCTHKDLVKIPRDELAGRPLRAIRIGLEFLRGQEDFEASLPQR